MATYTKVGSFDKSRQRIERLRVRLSNPQPLTEMLAASLVSYLEANAPVAKGTLKEGLTRVVIQSPTHASIGDPAVLTSWQEKPPPGTIGDFVRWLREQNAKKAGVRAHRARRVTHVRKIRSIHYEATARSRYAEFHKSVEKIIQSPKRYYEGAQIKRMRQGWTRLSRQTAFVPKRGYVRMGYETQHAEALKILSAWPKRRMSKVEIEDLQAQFEYEFKTRRTRRK